MAGVKQGLNQRSVQVSPQAFVEAMRAEADQMLTGVMAAVNAARDGAWINGSEREVRDLLGDFRTRVFERALQMKVEAAEGAFSPGGPGDGRPAQEQGKGPAQHADGQRPRPHHAAAVRPG